MRCNHCRHLLDEGEQHTCPTEAYLAARSALFEDALQAEEIFSLDELEEHE